MNIDDQRIALLTAMGWTNIGTNKEWLREYGYEGEDVWTLAGTDPHGDREPLPELTLDLMHEAEKVLTGYQIGFYQDWIRKLVPNPPEHLGGLFPVIHATATIRAEAFLRAKGLWVG